MAWRRLLSVAILDFVDGIFPVRDSLSLFLFIDIVRRSAFRKGCLRMLLNRSFIELIVCSRRICIRAERNAHKSDAFYRKTRTIIFVARANVAKRKRKKERRRKRREGEKKRAGGLMTFIATL